MAQNENNAQNKASELTQLLVAGGGFNPNYDAPQTDEEVAKCLELYDIGIKENLTGIYRCQRLMGNNVIDSWEYTLRTHLKIYEENKVKGESN